MKGKVKAMDNFVTFWDIWLVNRMCLILSYLWHSLYDLFYYRRQQRAFTIQVHTKPSDMWDNIYTLIVKS